MFIIYFSFILIKEKILDKTIEVFWSYPWTNNCDTGLCFVHLVYCFVICFYHFCIIWFWNISNLNLNLNLQGPLKGPCDFRDSARLFFNERKLVLGLSPVSYVMLCYVSQPEKVSKQLPLARIARWLLILLKPFRYWTILNNIVQYYIELPNIVQYCPILSGIAQYYPVFFKWIFQV